MNMKKIMIRVIIFCLFLFVFKEAEAKESGILSLKLKDNAKSNWVYMDLDGDGNKEKIRVEQNGEIISLYIDDFIISSVIENEEEYALMDINTEDNYKEIAIAKRICELDCDVRCQEYECKIYRYVNKKLELHCFLSSEDLKRIGPVWDNDDQWGLYGIQPGNGKIRIVIRGVDAAAYKDFEVKDRRIKITDNNRIYNFYGEHLCSIEEEVKIKKDLNSKKANIVLKFGDVFNIKKVFVSSKGEHTYYIEVKNGKKGWITRKKLNKGITIG